MREINAAGLQLIKNFEGCKLVAYKDLKGIWTIGYGNTNSNITQGEVISPEEADYLLEQDLQWFERGVEALVGDKVNDNQFSALVCFAFNLGLHTLRQSSLLKEFLAGHIQAAADEFLSWIHVNGEVVPGLLKRREAERALFLTPEASS